MNAAKRPAMALLERLLAPNNPLQSKLFFLAKRFVAGETIDSAIRAIRALNDRGMIATVDFLGEDVYLRNEAERTRDTYFALLDAIGSAGVRSNVSVKLTALGLLIDEDLARANLLAIVERARALRDPFVRIDMEGSALVGATLRLFESAYAQYKNVGPVLQSYLKRSPADIERAIALGARVRLCKGAYDEPAEIALRDMPAIRRQYVELAKALLLHGHYPGLATHDREIIAALKAFSAANGIRPETFEFQMLYGIRPGAQRALVDAGYTVRIYVPFGTHWAGYFYRRITERKENVFFVLKSLLPG